MYLAHCCENNGGHFLNYVPTVDVSWVVLKILKKETKQSMVLVKLIGVNKGRHVAFEILYCNDKG